MKRCEEEQKKKKEKGKEGATGAIVQEEKEGRGVDLQSVYISCITTDWGGM